jgi:hypothetical protein
MRTIAIAASIALITGGGVAGIVVGGAGADIARDYASNPYVQPNSGTAVMRRPARMVEAVPENPVASELRPGHDTPAPAPARVAEGLTTDMDAVFPENHVAPTSARSTIAAVTPRRPARLAPRPAERVQLRPTPTTSRPVPLRAQQAPPVRVVNRTPPARTATQPAATVTPPQPQATTAAPAQPRATRRTSSRQPARTTRTDARPSAGTTVVPETAPPPVMAPSPTATASDPTHRTTMSQGGPVATAPAPVPPSAAPLPAAPAASAPPPAETPSALLANP